MKCKVPRIDKKTRKELDAYLKTKSAEYYDKLCEEITRRAIKISCGVLHEKFGFGTHRENEYLAGVAEDIEKAKTDEVFWYHRDRLLIDKIGLKFEREDYEVMDK